MCDPHQKARSQRVRHRHATPWEDLKGGEGRRGTVRSKEGAAASSAPCPLAAPPPSSAQDEERKRLVANMRRLSQLYKDVEDKEGPEVMKELKSNITNAFRNDIVTLATRVKIRRG